MDKCNCQSNDCCQPDKSQKTLIVKWQRLVNNGDTCPRCGSTEDELNKAIKLLKKSLKPLGVEVVLDKIEMSMDEFKKNPTESNSIRFNGIKMEDAIGAESGKSKCCDVCGDEECLTVDYDGTTYETIPADIIIKAGLTAASRL